MRFLDVPLQIPGYLAPESTRSLRDAEPQMASCLDPFRSPVSHWAWIAGMVCDPCLHGAQGSVGAAEGRQDVITENGGCCRDKVPTGGMLVCL